MKRTYNIGNDISNVTFFVGTEVEHTPAYNMNTLFVVGAHDSETVLEYAKHPCGITHIYFGANQSFKTEGADDYTAWTEWESMIKPCLDAGYWCTLDIDVTEVEGLAESGLSEYRRFIPMISVKVPYIAQLNYNATIKIDDIGFEATNPGVWCHRVSELTKPTVFTDWDKYTQDEILK